MRVVVRRAGSPEPAPVQGGFRSIFTWLCYLGIHQYLDDFRHIAAGKATTMGHIQRHHLSYAKVDVLSPALLRVMDPIVEPIVESTGIVRFSPASSPPCVIPSAATDFG